MGSTDNCFLESDDLPTFQLSLGFAYFALFNRLR